MALTKEDKKAEKAKKVMKADAKAVKHTTAKLMSDLRAMTEADLNKALIEARNDLKQSKKMLAANELPASHVIKNMKAKVARIHLVMTENANNKEAK